MPLRSASFQLAAWLDPASWKLALQGLRLPNELGIL